MPKAINAESVGIVEPQQIQITEPLELSCGKVLSRYNLAYETYGSLNNACTNAILICHALSGHHHAAGYHSVEDKKPGWWDCAIGPGKPIDTNLFYVVAVNNLGGCHGSTGPTSINPETGEPFGADFPVVTVKDWVNSQAILADKLGIKQWAAVVGGSLGGMQALQWSIQYPERLRHAVVIASAAKLSAQNIAFNEVARQAIMSDDGFQGGHYLANKTAPKKGLALARMVGHITYLSDDAMGQKFGRGLQDDKISFDYAAQFQVESYLRYQGSSFSNLFDANTYLLMTKALDYFDPAQPYDNSLTQAFEPATCKFLLISFSSDWRFSPERSHEIRDALLQAAKPVSYLEIDAPQGHDAFLLAIPRYMDSLRTYLKRVAGEASSLTPAIPQEANIELTQDQTQNIPGAINAQ